MRTSSPLASPPRAWLEQLDGSGEESLVALSYLAGRETELDRDERNAAVRRALFVFAAGGDPHREPSLDDPAVLSLAADLDDPTRRRNLDAGFRTLRRDADGLRGATAQLDRLAADSDLAWRAFACSLLAEELGED